MSEVLAVCQKMFWPSNTRVIQEHWNFIYPNSEK